MSTAGTAFGVALLTSTILTPMVRNAALRGGFVDHALTSRKVHEKSTPRLGGVAIVAGFFAPLVALLLMNSHVGQLFTAESRLVIGLFVGGLAIALLGLYDDLRGADAKKKFAVQFGVGAFSYAMGFRIDSVALPLVNVVNLGALGLPLTMLWIAGVINALNLIDGLDGLAGGVALLAVASLSLIAFSRSDALMVLFGATLAGSLLGFLFFNSNPASIFMGDTGSMFLGFVLATTSIQTSEKSSAVIALLVPVVALGVPIGDTLLAMTRRAARGVPLFSADRGHIHHRLLARGLSQRETVLVIYGITVCLGGVAFLLVKAPDHQALMALAVLFGSSVALLRWLGFLDLNRIREVLDARKRNLFRRRQVVQIGDQLKRATDSKALEPALAAMVPALAVHHVRLRAAGRSWVHGPGCRSGVRVAKYGLDPEHPGAEILELGLTQDVVALDRDTEIAVEQLCTHLRAALRRGQREGWITPAAQVSPAGRVTHFVAANEGAAANAQRAARKIVNA